MQNIKNWWNDKDNKFILNFVILFYTHRNMSYNAPCKIVKNVRHRSCSQIVARILFLMIILYTQLSFFTSFSNLFSQLVPLLTVEEGRQSKNTLATIRELVAKEGSYVHMLYQIYAFWKQISCASRRNEWNVLYKLWQTHWETSFPWLTDSSANTRIRNLFYLSRVIVLNIFIVII